MAETKSAMHVEGHSPPEVEQANAAVLLDIGSFKGDIGEVNLKLAKDGRVCYHHIHWGNATC